MVLLGRLQEAVVVLHQSGFELWYQESGRRGIKTEDMPVIRVPDVVLQKLAKQEKILPWMRFNKSALKQAYTNKVVLKGFRLADFLSRSRLPSIKNAKPFVKGADWVILTRNDGPRMVISEDGYILLLYIPNYFDDENRALMERTLDAYTSVVPPKIDNDKGDKRSSRRYLPFLDTGSLGDNHTPAKQVDEDWAEYLGSPLADESHSGLPWINPSPTFPPQRHSMDPASFHHCLGWFARGQYGRKPPVVSTELRAAFKSKETLEDFIAHHIGKSMADHRINDLIMHLHPTFYQLMCRLRNELFEAELPPPVLWDVWSSIFTFQSVGFNRQTEMHRDAAGMHGGLDVLFLLGDHTGGRMRWPDLPVKADWLPGDLCAFDGKILSHGIERWSGSKRLCFIYFAHRNVLSHFGLPDTCCYPSESEIVKTLDL
ncbi:hypothetical protein RhiJN_25825 [Ceratobasidium sp. AG-Ba]|nr:hypothetical protein RhiJN_25825 [Ceratobasidium sp. AG-Ba]